MSAEQPTVLVVEDEPAQREVLSYNLEAEGFRVSRAEEGEQALLLAEDDAPDIILLDAPKPGRCRSSCSRPVPRRWTWCAAWKPGPTTMW